MQVQILSRAPMKKKLLYIIGFILVILVCYFVYSLDGWILSILILSAIFSYSIGKKLQKNYYVAGVIFEALAVLVLVVLFSQFSNSKAVVDIIPNSSDTILTIKNSGLVNVEGVGVSLETYNINSNLSIDYVYKSGGGGSQNPLFKTIQPYGSQEINLSFLAPSSTYAPPNYGDLQVSVARITYRNSINKTEYIHYFVLSPIINPSSETGISGPFQKVNDLNLIRQEIINDQIATFNDNSNNIDQDN